MMPMLPPFVARAQQLRQLGLQLNNCIASRGSVVLVTGEASHGKSSFLLNFEQEHASKSNLACAYIACQSPIGDVNIGGLKPLHPFTHAIEIFVERQREAKKKFGGFDFAKFFADTGSSWIDLIPGVGRTVSAAFDIASAIYDQFYLNKKLEAKQQAESTRQGNARDLISQTIDLLVSMSEKIPVVLVIDDIHWADAQSIELIHELAQSINQRKIMLVCSYSPSYLQEHISPLGSFLSEWKNDFSAIHRIDLPAFGLDEISSCCSAFFPGYRRSHPFEEWLLQRTSGIPGVVAEYLRHFQRNNPFNPDGSLIDGILLGETIPTNVHATFGKLVEQLSDEERNLLALCSAEGMECTAYMVANLLNTDVLTAIRRLKSLQSKTGIIRSSGAHDRYGIRTTVYGFSQSFYQQFFHKSLEFEERSAVHDQIAGFLGKILESEPSEVRKAELAPYIAAHSMEGGHPEEARSYVAMSTRAQQSLGLIRPQTADERRQEWLGENISQGGERLSGAASAALFPEDSQWTLPAVEQTSGLSEAQAADGPKANESSTITPEALGKDVIAKVAQLIVSGSFADARTIAQDALLSASSPYKLSEIGILRALSARALVGLAEYDQAKIECLELLAQPDMVGQRTTIALAYNVIAYAEYATGGSGEALSTLRLLIRQGPMELELQMLTSINIAACMPEGSNGTGDRFANNARRIAKALGFQNILPKRRQTPHA